MRLRASESTWCTSAVAWDVSFFSGSEPLARAATVVRTSMRFGFVTFVTYRSVLGKYHTQGYGSLGESTLGLTRDHPRR